MSEPATITPIQRKSGKYERHIYYRRPSGGQQSRWIVTGGNNAGRVESMGMRGFEPLFKYGQIPVGEDKWSTILNHPDGPLEFPADQVLTLRWYKEPPVPGIKFPQLSGHKVVEYRCPECDRPPFTAIDGTGGIDPLARHLRITHTWDRAALVKYGDKIGVDFDAIYSADIGGPRVSQAIEFGEKQSGDNNCPECDWTPKSGAKNPIVALRMHKRIHQLEVSAVG